MPLSLTAYRKMMADPKRGEASSKAAATRLWRQGLYSALFNQLDDVSGDVRAKVGALARQRGGIFLDLIGTKWVK